LSEGDNSKSHPVLYKITTLKQTLDGLQPLDDKLERALKHAQKGTTPGTKRSRVEFEEEEEGEDS